MIGEGVSGFRNLLYLLCLLRRSGVKRGAEIIIYDFVILLLLPSLFNSKLAGRIIVTKCGCDINGIHREREIRQI